ncbi:Adenylate kinase [hydrothermal vent metagenome]|uniref:Adenylate kinase n=1 Tax=hydrothermal vent metagenome TaxID=652676 RepID=A0A3B1DE80_9ZZZZ
MPTSQYRTILLFGAPGVGKGTQGHILGQIPGFFHLSCGDVFRSLDISSPEGKEVYHHTSKGELVPNDLTIKIWKKGLNARIALSSFKPREDLLILDGIPRNIEQAECLKEHVEVLRVIHLVCSDEEEMIHRIRRRAIHANRADDANEGIIRHRFDVYHRESKPVLDFYPPEMVFEIDALGSPAAVLSHVLDVVVPVQDEHFRQYAD